MLKHLGVCWLLLALVLVPFVNAETLAEQASSGSVTTIDTANKYLTAESKKEIQAQMKIVQDELIANNDNNFRELDVRMFTLMEEVRTKVIVGGMGAVFVAQAIGMFLLLNSMKKNSFEAYLTKLLEAQGAAPPMQASISPQEAKTLEQLQQGEWSPQDESNTMATQYGAAQAGEMSQMNQWQTQPVYDGAWRSPQEYEPYIERYTPDESHMYTGEIPVQDPQQRAQDDSGQYDIIK